MKKKIQVGDMVYAVVDGLGFSRNNIQKYKGKAFKVLKIEPCGYFGEEVGVLLDGYANTVSNGMVSIRSLKFAYRVEPRPHADVIRAWADGEYVQFLHESTGEWCDVEKPSFNENFKYRVKPPKQSDQNNEIEAIAKEIALLEKINSINISFDYNQMKATLLGERHTMPDFKNLAEIEDWLDNL